MFEKIVLATDLCPAWDEIVAGAREFKELVTTRALKKCLWEGARGLRPLALRPKPFGRALTALKLREGLEESEHE
jgi:hypothetical protein